MTAVYTANEIKKVYDKALKDKQYNITVKLQRLGIFDRIYEAASNAKGFVYLKWS